MYLGGYTALSTKGVASLLSFTLWHVITFPITYGLVAVLVVSALMQIRYINRALQRFDSTQVIPTQFVFFTISVIVGSALLYRDFESTTFAQASKFIGGCALTFLGVYFITSGRERADDGSSLTDEEESIGLLGGERYRDTVDEEEPQTQRQRHSDAGEPQRVLIAQSPPRSLLSDEREPIENEEGLQTPKAQLSSVQSSPEPSVSDASSISRSLDGSPDSQAVNPLVGTPRSNTVQAPESESEPPTTEPRTPPPPTNVLLQFPSAPGVIGTPTHQTQPDYPLPPTPGEADSTPNNISRQSTAPRTPRSTQRNSLSKRLAPGPFLPPLSSGLSAVVAESLRRGEGSPGQRRGRTGAGRRKRSKKRVTTRTEEPVEGHADADADADGEGDGGGGGNESEYETDGSYMGPEDGTMRRPQLNKQTPGSGSANVHVHGPARSTTQDAIPRLSSQRRTLEPAPEPFRQKHSRMRSLSDSWSENMGRKTEAARRDNNNNTNTNTNNNSNAQNGQNDGV